MKRPEAAGNATKIDSIPVDTTGIVAGNGLFFNGTTLIPASATVSISNGSIGANKLGTGAAVQNVGAGGITANELASSVAGAGLTGGGGSALAVNTDGSSLDISGDTVQIKTGGVTNAKLGAEAVNGDKIDDQTWQTVTFDGVDASGAPVQISPVNASWGVNSIIDSVINWTDGIIQNNFDLTVANQVRQTGGDLTGKRLIARVMRRS